MYEFICGVNKRSSREVSAAWLNEYIPSNASDKSAQDLEKKIGKSSHSMHELENHARLFKHIAGDDGIATKDEVRDFFHDKGFEIRDFKNFWAALSAKDYDDNGIDFGEWIEAWEEIENLADWKYQLFCMDNNFWATLPIILAPLFSIINSFLEEKNWALEFCSHFSYFLGGVGVVYVLMEVKMKSVREYNYMDDSLKKAVFAESRDFSSSDMSVD